MIQNLQLSSQTKTQRAFVVKTILYMGNLDDRRSPQKDRGHYTNENRNYKEQRDISRY